MRNAPRSCTPPRLTAPPSTCAPRAPLAGGGRHSGPSDDAWCAIARRLTGQATWPSEHHGDDRGVASVLLLSWPATLQPSMSSAVTPSRLRRQGGFHASLDLRFGARRRPGSLLIQVRAHRPESTGGTVTTTAPASSTTYVSPTGNATTVTTPAPRPPSTHADAGFARLPARQLPETTSTPGPHSRLRGDITMYRRRSLGIAASLVVLSWVSIARAADPAHRPDPAKVTPTATFVQQAVVGNLFEVEQ